MPNFDKAGKLIPNVPLLDKDGKATTKEALEASKTAVAEAKADAKVAAADAKAEAKANK